MTTIARIAAVVALLPLLASCVRDGPTWFEQRCQRTGFTRGSAGFEECVARDRAWVERTLQRSEGPSGP